MTEERARSLVETYFRKQVSSVAKLDSYDDNNFRVVVAGSGETYTLKVNRELSSFFFLARELLAM